MKRLGQISIMAAFILSSGSLYAQTTENILEEIRDINTGIAETNQGILDAQGDMSRREHAQALINYEAEARLKAYELEEQKMYMAAPGTNAAIKAGQDAAEDAYGDTVKNIVDSAIVRAMAVGDPNETSSLASKIELVNALKPYLNSGNAEDLSAVDFSTVMQSEAVDQTTVDRFIDVLTNSGSIPLSVSRDPVTDEITLTGPEIEAIGTRAEKVAMMSVAVNALGELGAKRIVNPDTNKSLAQIIKEESERRFENLEWYKNVGVSSQEALLRELVQMEAFRTMLQYQQYRMQEQTVSLLSAVVAAQAKLASTVEMLSSAMDAAAASAQDAASRLPEDLGEIDLDIPE